VNVRKMVEAHPRPPAVDRDLLVRCIEECLECGAACTACADASLAEEDVLDLLRCIRLCLDCADLCEATGRVLLRQTAFEPGVARAAAEACAVACRTSAEECERHAAHHEHCRLCADACRRCEEACDDLVVAL